MFASRRRDQDRRHSIVDQTVDRTFEPSFRRDSAENLHDDGRKDSRQREIDITSRGKRFVLLPHVVPSGLFILAQDFGVHLHRLPEVTDRLARKTSFLARIRFDTIEKSTEFSTLDGHVIRSDETSHPLAHAPAESNDQRQINRLQFSFLLFFSSSREANDSIV